tara:strand:+ start:2780 stop:3373 length:594 start_codon:yes stop_codon:yes gene_type:complete
MDDLTIILSKNLENECIKIIQKISHLKHLEENQMIDLILPNKLYFNELANNLISKKKKKTNRRILPKNERCLGRKNDLTQCTRKRKDDHTFCGSHIKNLPNGEVGDDGACFNKKKGKRGRKRKNLLDVQNENGILTTKKYINGSIYLIDSNNIIYTFRDNKPVILGVLKDNLLDSTKFINISIDDPLIKKSIDILDK